MVICDCGKEFLTEADPHIVIPSEGYKLYCGCKVSVFKTEVSKVDNKNKELKHELTLAIHALKDVLHLQVRKSVLNAGKDFCSETYSTAERALGKIKGVPNE